MPRIKNGAWVYVAFALSLGSLYLLAPMIVPGLVLLTIAPLAGAWIFARCWRGKPIDDHPVCRQCRYDLFGSPEPRNNCPECGADLKTDKAIGIGNLKRQTASAVVAGLVTLASAAMLVRVVSAFYYCHVLY